MGFLDAQPMLWLLVPLVYRSQCVLPERTSMVKGGADEDIA
jgi:hypothetical protein